MPTVPNFVLKYGSLKGFFDEYSADVICFQVSLVLPMVCMTYVPICLMHQQVRVVSTCEQVEITYSESRNLLSFIYRLNIMHTGDEIAKRREADKGDSLR